MTFGWPEETFAAKLLRMRVEHRLAFPGAAEAVMFGWAAVLAGSNCLPLNSQNG